MEISVETRLIPGRANAAHPDADHYPLIFHRDTARSHLLLMYADFMPFDIWLPESFLFHTRADVEASLRCDVLSLFSWRG